MKKHTAVLISIISIFLIAFAFYIFNKKDNNKKEQHNITQPNLNLTPNDIYTVKPITFTKSITITGLLVPIQNAKLKAKNTGEITNLKLKVGDSVKKGQIVAIIENLDINSRLHQSNSQIKISQQQLDLAKLEYNKNLELAKENIITKNGLDTVKTNLEVAQQNLSSAISAYQINKKAISDKNIIASFLGIVSKKLVENGEKVSIDTQILEIVDNSSLELEAGISADEINNIQIRQKVNLKIEGIEQNVIGFVSRISPAANSNNSRLINVYIKVDNPENMIKSGIFAKGFIILGDKELNAIPEASIVHRTQQKPFVYVISGNKLIRTEINEIVYKKDNLVGVDNLVSNTKIVSVPLPSDTDIQRLDIKY